MKRRRKSKYPFRQEPKNEMILYRQKATTSVIERLERDLNLKKENKDEIKNNNSIIDMERDKTNEISSLI